MDAGQASQARGSSSGTGMAGSGEVPVELSLSLPAGTSVEALFQKAPAAEAGDGSDEDGEDWEDVGGSGSLPASAQKVRC